MHQGQAHVGEAVVHIDPFVEEHDADGHQQVEQEPGGDAPVAPHSLRQRCHDPHEAGALQPPTGTPRLPPAALALFLRGRVPAAAGFSFWPAGGSRASNSRVHMLRHRPLSPRLRGGTSRAPRPLPRDSGRPRFRPQLGAGQPLPCAGALGSGCAKRLSSLPVPP